MSDSARQAARLQWGAHPAGTTEVDAEPGTPEFFAQMTRTRYEQQPWHPALLRSFHPVGRVLEIGCGAGTDHAELAKTARETAAVDLAPEGVSLTNTRLRLAGLPETARVADAETLPYDDASFDEVYSFGVIHHTDHPERVVAEIHRVLRPGGRFMVALYHRDSLFAAEKVYDWARNHRAEPWTHYLAGLEKGADELEQRPIVRLYSRRQARRLFSAFRELRTQTVHPFFHGRLRGRWAEPFGWYVVVTGRR